MSSSLFLASRRLNRGALGKLWSQSSPPAACTLGETVHIVTEEELNANKDVVFSVSKFWDHLGESAEQQQPAQTGLALLCANQIQSTQQLVHGSRLGVGGVVCLADLQTGGRGRGGNTWESDVGCLMFTYQCELDRSVGTWLPQLQYLVTLNLVQALAVVDARFGRTSGDPLVRIKWPNDLYSHDGKKVGGVLCQSEFKADKFVVTVGIGVNVNNTPPTEAAQSIARLCPNGDKLSRENILAQFLIIWDKALAKFKESGFSTFREQYTDAWMHTGQQVTLPDGSTAVVRGIAESGFLLAEESEKDGGGMCELHPDGNSFDWFKGLIKRKK